MKKSLWIINQYAGSPYHGMNFRSYYFASELTERGYHVEIISGSYSHLMTAPPEVEGVFTREEVDGIGYNWIRLPRYKNSKSIMRFVTMLIFLWRLFFFRSEKLIRPDVILVSSISPFPILWAYLKAKRFGAKLVFEVRDIWPMTLQYLGNYSRFHPVIIILQWLENFAYKHCDYAVALLPKADEHMYEHGLKKGRFRYIPNGIRIEDFKKPIPLQEDILAKIPKQKFIVGYVGTIGIANALNFLLDAAVSLQENSMIHFIVVGQGGSKQELMDRVSHEGLQNVSFFDPIPKLQVPSMLKECDVLYIGWHDEPELYRFGVSANKLFEYMYAAKPVIHAIHAGNDPVSEAGAGMSVAPENSEAIVAAILKLQRMSRNEKELMGEKGRNFVMKHHTYPKLAAKYEEFFEEIR